MSDTLAIALFKHSGDNLPDPLQVSWDELREKLSRHRRKEEKGGMLWSPTLYKEGASRGKAHVEQVSCFVLDFDCGMMPGPFRAEFNRWEHVIYSSFSHDPDFPKWRVVFPLREPVSGAEWEQIYDRLAPALGKGFADPSCRDSSRIYYLPYTRSDGHPFVEHHAGEWLDLAAYPEMEEKPKAAAAPKRAPQTAQQGVGAYGTLDVVAWFQAHGHYGEPGSEAGKHHVLCPWEQEHSDRKARPEEDSDTVVYEGDGLNGWPQFCCLHGHCIDRTISDVIDLWGDADRYCARTFETTPSRRFDTHKRERSSVEEIALAQTELAAARTLIEETLPTLKERPGNCFNPAMLRALELMRKYDQPFWMNTRAAIQKAKVPIRDVLDALPISVRLPVLDRELFGVDDGDDNRPRFASTMLRDCPAPQVVIPQPYTLSDSQITRIGADEDGRPLPQTVAFAPVLIVGRARDITSGSVSVVLCWKWPHGAWSYRVVDRHDALMGRSITQLARFDFPVSDDNAKSMVAYLHRLEAANRHTLPTAQVTSRLGWIGEPQEHGAFLVGQKIIQPDGAVETALPLDAEHPEEWNEKRIAFHPQSDGNEQLAAGFRSRGTFDAWAQIIKDVAGHPKVMVGFYAAFCSPLLHVFESPNFFVDYSNRTTTGKTTSMRVAASIWGNPDEKTADSVISSWDITPVFIERASATVSALPIFLDDTKKCQRPEKTIPAVIYGISNGRGRSRGTLNGIARTDTWKTVAFSTSEDPLVSYTQDGGTRTRCIQLRGVPFGKQERRVEQLVTRVNRGLVRNYGHAGVRFMQWFMQQREQWDEWRERIEQWQEYYAERAASPEGGRLAHYVALITVVGEMVHQALELPWKHSNPMLELWEEVSEHAADAAGEGRALQDLISWAHANEHRFFGREPENQFGRTLPSNVEMAGRWDPEEDWKFIAFFKPVLRKVLADMDYRPDAIIGGWKEKGWLNHEKGRNDIDTRLGDGKKDRLIQINRRGVEEAQQG